MTRNGLSTGTDAQIEKAWQALISDPTKPLVSHAFQDLYLPGSTFKTITASAALDNNWPPRRPGRTPITSISPARPRIIENFGDEFCAGGASTVTMEQAFTSSCNVPFAEIGMALGPTRWPRRRRRTGSARSTPVAGASALCQDDTIPFILPWQTGRFPVASYFDNNEAALARSSIGLDNDLLNPLHLGLIAAAIANGGTMFEPRLVTEVRDATTGQTIASFGPKEFSHPLTSSSAAELRAMMVNVVNSGTGTPAQIPGRSWRGKTGTSANTKGPPNAWFTAFAPGRPGADRAHRRGRYRARRRRPRERGDRRPGRRTDREAGHRVVPPRLREGSERVERSTIGERYTVEARIGQGGMAEVFRGLRPLARPHRRDQDPPPPVRPGRGIRRAVPP